MATRRAGRRTPVRVYARTCMPGGRGARGGLRSYVEFQFVPLEWPCVFAAWRAFRVSERTG